MAHHKRRSRRSDSNFDLNWDATSRERKLPIEDGPSNGKVHGKKGCKRNKGGAHDIGLNPLYGPTYVLVWDSESQTFVTRWNYRHRSYNRYACRKCGKGFYNLPQKGRPKPAKPDRDAEHWTMTNIQNRLAGLPCGCPTCRP